MFVQLKNSYTKYQTKETTDKLKIKQTLHNKAIGTNNIEDCREFRNYRKIYQRK